MKRVLIAIVVFVVFAALSLLLPAASPGEMAASEMTHHGDPPCQACPPPEQLTDIGLAATDAGWFLNVRFATVPIDARVRITLDGAGGAIDLRRTGKAWKYLGKPAAGAPALRSVTERDGLVVFGFSDGVGTNGVAVATASGDRLPASGFVAPHYASAPRFNATDAVLVAILLATAWYGYRRGALGEAADLASIVLGLVVAAFAYRPLAAALSAVAPGPRGAAILASGILVVGVALVGFAVLPRVLQSARRTASALDPMLNGVAGSTMACARQLAVLAMLLTAGVDLAALHWAAPSINSSLLGTTLLRTWRTLFSA